MSRINIDSIITSLNVYLKALPLYTTRTDVLVLQSNEDSNTLEEPYASVGRGTDVKPSYQKARQTRQDDLDGLKVTFNRNDKFDLQFQCYSKSTDDSKQLAEDIYNYFMYVVNDISIREITDITPSSFTIANQTTSTFLFSVTIEDLAVFETIEEKIEGVEIIVN